MPHPFVNPYRQPLDAFVAQIRHDMRVGVKHNKVSATKLAKSFGIFNDNNIKELVELSLVLNAREIIQEQRSAGSATTFNKLVSLYQNQMNLAHRTSQSVLLQQYSTPAPISYLAGLFCASLVGEDWIGLEPSAGNGLLTIAGTPNHWVVNEIDNFRNGNLKSQGYRATFQKDSSERAALSNLKEQFGGFDVVVTNPPFGKIDSQILHVTSPQGKTTEFHIKSLEQSMAIHALSTMKGDGTAAIIVGGHTEYNRETGMPKHGKNLIFQYYLSSNYNVLDVIPIDGHALYSRQGTAFDTRLILIKGRKPHDPASFPRKYSADLDTPVTDFQVLYDRVTDAVKAASPTQTSTPTDEMRRKHLIKVKASAMKLKLKMAAARLGVDGLGLPYVPAAEACNVLEVEMPDAMAFDGQQALSELKREVGDVTAFVAQRLHYRSKDELCQALAAEQIDSVALAIVAVENHSQGIIIGDQTGIGKGRQAAAMIRYGVLHGMTPIFLTVKPNLFTDLYRDLSAIGSDDLTPYIVNALDNSTKIKNESGDVIHKPLPKAEQDRHIQERSLPSGANFLMSTYSQLSVGHVKTKQGLLLTMSDKAKFTLHFAKDSIIILDESHNAAGDSLVGQVMSEIVNATKGTVYLSATFAKRPDNMPLYALKTVLNEANMTSDSLKWAFSRGGIALQEVVSTQLVRNGQMIRRQRAFDGIEVNYITLDATASKYGMQDKSREHRAVANIFTALIRDVISFQRVHVNPIIKQLDKRLQGQYAAAMAESGVKDAGVNNTPYFSRVFNVINQMLFAIKADDVADRAIQRLKEGKKPVIAFSSTMGSFVEELLTDDESDEIDGNTAIKADFSTVLFKALDSVLKYRIKELGGKASGAIVNVDDLSASGRYEYYKIKKKINGLLTGLSISPIDQIKQKIEAAGFKVAEVTGRNYEVVLRSKLVDAEAWTDDDSSGEPLKVSDIPKQVRKIMPNFQQEAIVGSEEHGDILEQLSLNATLAKKQYKDPYKSDEHKIALHYFYGGSDWYVTGWDGDDTLYGYAILNGDKQMAEWGYSSLAEMTSLRNKMGGGVELDFFWTPIPTTKEVERNVWKFWYELEGDLDGLRGYDVHSSLNLSWTGTVKRRKKENAADAFRKFQNNKVDVLMINQAGATGASAHAIPTKAVPANQVKQRVMIVLQAELDINKEVQKRGRINRTGQIIKPIYDYVTSDIPAEARMMMMLQRKLKSLDANTTSNQNNSEELLKSEDFLNKYGDKLAADYLEENTPFAVSIDMAQEEEGMAAPEDLAYKVAGRVAILPTDNQEAFYKAMIQNYQDYAKRLYERGEYDLEVETLNLEAKQLSRLALIVGGGGRSAFGDNTYLEESEVNNLRKPFKADELISLVLEATGGVPLAEFNGMRLAQQLFDEMIVPDVQLRLANVEEKTASNLAERIAEIPTLAEYRSKTTEDAREQFQRDKKQEYEKKADANKSDAEIKIHDEKNRAKRVLGYFTIGKQVELDSAKGVAVQGIVLGIRFKKPHASKPKGMEVEIAVPNSQKTATFNLEKEGNTELLAIMGRGPGMKFGSEREMIDAWVRATASRQSNRIARYIVTGNVLQAYSRSEVVGYGAKLVDFSTIDGKRRKGILLPETFAPALEQDGKPKEDTVAVPIMKALPILRSLIPGRSKQSVDGGLSIIKDHSYDFKLIVPKARSKGGDIYTDFGILEYVDDNNFNSISNTMVATFDADRLDDIARILSTKFKVALTLTRQEFDRISADILEADKGADEIIIPVVQPNIVPPEMEVPADEARERKLRLIRIKAKAMKLKLKLAAAALELSL